MLKLFMDSRLRGNDSVAVTNFLVISAQTGIHATRFPYFCDTRSREERTSLRDKEFSLGNDTLGRDKPVEDLGFMRNILNSDSLL